MTVQVEYAYVQPNLFPRNLQLLHNGLVRFDYGRAHGHWEMEALDVLIIDFHWDADVSKIKRHRFRRIPYTHDFHVDGRAPDVEWWAALCRMQTHLTLTAD